MAGALTEIMLLASLLTIQIFSCSTCGESRQWGSVLHQVLLEIGRHVHMEFMCTTLLTSIMTGSSLSYVHHSRQTQLYISGHTVHIDIENGVTFTSYNHYFNHTEFDPQLVTDIFTVLFYRWCLRWQPLGMHHLLWSAPLQYPCTSPFWEMVRF